jgi:hypothetical protein
MELKEICRNEIKQSPLLLLSFMEKYFERGGMGLNVEGYEYCLLPNLQ